MKDIENAAVDLINSTKNAAVEKIHNADIPDISVNTIDVSDAIMSGVEAVSSALGTPTHQLLEYAVHGVRIEGIIAVLFALFANISIWMVFRKSIGYFSELKSFADAAKIVSVAVLASTLIYVNTSIFHEWKDGLVASFAPEWTIMKMIGEESFNNLKK